MNPFTCWRRRIAGGEHLKVKEEVLAVLGNLPKADQARAYGLVVACCLSLDQKEEGIALLAKGEALGVREAAARVELLAQGSSLWIDVGDAERARSYIEESLAIVEIELSKPEKPSKWSKDRRRWFIKAKARNLVVRGQLTFRLQDRPGREALKDAFEAIEFAKDFLSEQAFGVELVCQVLAFHGGIDEVVSVLRLTEAVDVSQRSKRLPRSHPYRLRNRWGRAIALARLGMDERAEAIMTEVAEAFITAGLAADARMAVEALLWITAERLGKMGRAQMMARKYREVVPGLAIPELPEPVAVGSVRGW